MNKGELKTIVDDFAELVPAIASKLLSKHATEQAELIVGQIIAGKAANGDYKNKNFYKE